MGLKSKVAMITGSGRSIGKEIALTMARSGADIVLVDVNMDDLQQTGDEIRQLGRDVHLACVDITDPVKIDQLAAEIKDRFGKLDILVNNAGITKDGSFLKMSLDQWRAVIDVNLTGTFICSQMAGRMMKEQKYGKIINITSLSGQIGNYGQSNYAASKAGVIGFTKTIAKEMARYGVNVNAIAPGFISTPMWDNIPKNVVDDMISQIPFGKAGEPSDIANLALFLSSDASQYITGQVISCNGGNNM